MDLGWRRDNLSFQDLNSCCKGDRSSGNMMLLICSCVRIFDSFIYSFKEIGIYPIHGTLPDLSNYLVTNILFSYQEIDAVLSDIRIIDNYPPAPPYHCVPN